MSEASTVLFDIDGDPLAVENNTPIPPLTSVLIGGGSDGVNAKFIRVNSDGYQIMIGAGTAGSPAGGVLTIQGDSAGIAVPILGTVTANIGTSGTLALDATLAKLTITPGTAIGSNTLTMIGGHVTTASPTYTNGNINPLSLTTAGALRIDGSGVTQPVSGTVTANQGTANTLANRWPVIITDGTNAAAIKAASTAAVAADPALVVAISPNNTVPTKEIRSSTGTTTTVAASATSVTLLSANANRLGATIYNDSAFANLFVKLGATASTTSFAVRLTPNGYYEVPYGYTGIIDGIWSVASGNARIVEHT